MIGPAVRSCPAAGAGVDVEGDGESQAGDGCAGTNSSVGISGEAGEIFEGSKSNGVIGRAVVFKGNAKCIGEGHPVDEFLVATLGDFWIVEEFASQAGVDNVFDGDIGIGDLDV